MNWLITGGCGFIGLKLVEQILKNKLGSVKILDNLAVGNLKI